MVTDKEFCDKTHMLIHSLRLIDKYNPSLAERRLSQMVIEKYSDDCIECKNIGETLKNMPKQKSFLDKIFGSS